MSTQRPPCAASNGDGPSRLPSARPVAAVVELGSLAASHAMHSLQLIMLMAIVTLTGCSRAPVVTITNRSTNALANVVVSGSGFSNRVTTIAAGGESSLTVRPTGESGLRIAFDAGNQHIDVDDLAYIERRGGYRVTVTVQPDLKVVASERVRGY